MKMALALLFITGCGAKLEYKESFDEEKIEDYKCSDKDLEMVKKQFSICNESSYVSSYCFLSSVKSHCAKKEVVK
jgi:hypothetical protein